MEKTYKTAWELQKDYVIKIWWAVHGVRAKLEDGRAAVKLDATARGEGIEIACDPTRADALFVVESSEYKGINHDCIGDLSYIEIIARRLGADGTYNPNGELVLLLEESDRSDAYPRKVELVGQMNFDRTAMTYTLPRK